ncbi:MAG: acyltransferase [Prevotella sp.]|nr:acyltransferase [Prevotella sp.]
MFATITAVHNGIIVIGEWAKIGPNSIIESTNKVEIGKDTAIATGVTIRDNNSHPISPSYRRKMRHTPHGSIERSSTRGVSAPIIIGENVWIGENSRICKGVTIGDNAIIAASSVVTKNVPANSIVAGNPAKIVKENIDLLPEPKFDE